MSHPIPNAALDDLLAFVDWLFPMGIIYLTKEGKRQLDTSRQGSEITREMEDACLNELYISGVLGPAEVFEAERVLARRVIRAILATGQSSTIQTTG